MGNFYCSEMNITSDIDVNRCNHSDFFKSSHKGLSVKLVSLLPIMEAGYRITTVVLLNLHSLPIWAILVSCGKSST